MREKLSGFGLVSIFFLLCGSPISLVNAEEPTFLASGFHQIDETMNILKTSSYEYRLEINHQSEVPRRYGLILNFELEFTIEDQNFAYFELTYLIPGGTKTIFDYFVFSKQYNFGTK